MKEELKDIIRTSLEDVMHMSFMPYAEYVILERALPRVEDGLKPVQRRILFSMHELQIFPDAKYKKCARIVGDTMGKYHPHGDTSIYDALVRMAQDFSMSIPLIDGNGNFGSIDGDGPAAMRYTEARLAPLAMEMLRDIDKDTVPFHLNFDDTQLEPTMLPSRYPNLLVNGATGIAVGLATNIPPHNLGEVIDGTIAMMKKPDITLDEMMEYIPAPDFPTGGKLMQGGELRQAYETGKGRISLRAKTEFEYDKNGKTRIVVTELPYEVRESAMLKKIQSLRETKKELFAGIDDVRSETDRSGIRAVIQLKKGVDEHKLLDCLLKYSDLQITYGINMVAIADGQPKQLGLLELLRYYIDYQRQVVRNRFLFDVEKAQEREHKLAGLIAAVSNIDLVIQIIRSSQDSKEAKKRLMDTLEITGVQAQAILDLRLARLTQLEIDVLKKEYADVLALLSYLNDVLNNPARLDGVIIEEMRQIKAKYSVKRRTKLSSKSADVVIDEEHFKVIEECAVVYTRGGNLKRMSPKALQKGAESGEIEERNLPAAVIETNTEEKLRVFTDLGNLYSLPVSAIREWKFKDAGSTINSLVAGFEKEEKVLSILKPQAGQLLTVSSSGMVKLTDMAEFDTKKSKVLACGLKEKDKLIYAQPVDSALPHLLLVTRNGMSIRFATEEISLQGRTAKGVGGIKLAAGDAVLFAAQTGGEDGNVLVFTDAGFGKQSKLAEYEIQGRNGKGLKTFQWAKGNGKHLSAAFLESLPAAYRLTTASGQSFDVSSADIPLEARYSKGGVLVSVFLGDTIQGVAKI